MITFTEVMNSASEFAVSLWRTIRRWALNEAVIQVDFVVPEIPLVSLSGLAELHVKNIDFQALDTLGSINTPPALNSVLIEQFLKQEQEKKMDPLRLIHPEIVTLLSQKSAANINLQFVDTSCDFYATETPGVFSAGRF